jgi:hypothetical protein
LRKWLKVQNKCPMCHANILALWTRIYLKHVTYKPQM